MYDKGVVDMEHLELIKKYYQSNNMLFVPMTASYELTLDCNLHCLHCYNRVKKGLAEKFKLQHKINVIDKLASLGVKEITLCGGEPLLDIDIIKVISYIKQKGMRIAILTNGLILRSELVECFRKYLSKDDVIQVSIDESRFSKSTQRNMSRNDFVVLRKNVTELCDLNCKIISNTTVTVYNEKRIMQIIKDIVNWGIKNIGFTSFVPFGSEKMDDIKPDYNYLGNLEKEIMRYCEESDVKYIGGISGHICENSNRANENKLFKLPLYRKCDAGRFNLHVSQERNIYPCVFMDKEIFKIASVYDTINEIKENATLLQKSIYTSFPKSCQECDRVLECNGGCIGLIYDRFGVLDERDPRCIYG